MDVFILLAGLFVSVAAPLMLRHQNKLMAQEKAWEQEKVRAVLANDDISVLSIMSASYLDHEIIVTDKPAYHLLKKLGAWIKTINGDATVGPCVYRLEFYGSYINSAYQEMLVKNKYLGT